MLSSGLWSRHPRQRFVERIAVLVHTNMLIKLVLHYFVAKVHQLQNFSAEKRAEKNYQEIDEPKHHTLCVSTSFFFFVDLLV